MRKIKWQKRSLYPGDRRAFVNGVDLDCNYEDKKWCSSARLGTCVKMGVWFDSLKEAQEDCVRLAQQILTEYHECMARIMKSFDMECEIS